MVFETEEMALVDLGRREIKAILRYKDIKDIILESGDKIKILFTKEINEVINFNN